MFFIVVVLVARLPLSRGSKQFSHLRTKNAKEIRLSCPLSFSKIDFQTLDVVAV